MSQNHQHQPIILSPEDAAELEHGGGGPETWGQEADAFRWEPGPDPVGVPAVAFAGMLGALARCLGFEAVRARLAR